MAQCRKNLNTKAKLTLPKPLHKIRLAQKRAPGRILRSAEAEAVGHGQEGHAGSFGAFRVIFRVPHEHRLRRRDPVLLEAEPDEIRLLEFALLIRAPDGVAVPVQTEVGQQLPGHGLQLVGGYRHPDPPVPERLAEGKDPVVWTGMIDRALPVMLPKKADGLFRRPLIEAAVTGESNAQRRPDEPEQPFPGKGRAAQDARGIARAFHDALAGIQQGAVQVKDHGVYHFASSLRKAESCEHINTARSSLQEDPAEQARRQALKDCPKKTGGRIYKLFKNSY